LSACSILLGAGFSDSAVSEILGIPKNTINNVQPAKVNEEQSITVANYVVSTNYPEAETICRLYDMCNGVISKELFTIDAHLLEESKTYSGKKYVFAADFHIPFQIAGIDDYIVENYSRRADTIIIGGDFMDLQMASKYYNRDEGYFTDIYFQALDIITKFSSAFKRVIMIKGNHSERVDKKIRSIPELRGIDTILSGNVLHHLASGNEFVDGMPVKVRKHENVEYYDSRFIKIGTVVYQHPDDFVEFSAMAKRSVQHWIARHRDVTDIVTAHTHRVGEYQYMGVNYYESGCLMGQADYLVKDLKLRKEVPAQGLMYIETNADTSINTFKSYTEKLTKFSNMYRYYMKDLTNVAP